MAYPNAFLIAWWLLFGSMVLATWAPTWIADRQERRSAEVAYLRGDYVGAYRPFPNPVSTPIGIGLVVVGWLLVIGGGVALFEMRDWTKLHVLSSRFFLMLLGCVLGWGAWHYARQDWTKQVMGRLGLAIVATLMIVVGSHSLLGDLFGERRVVEGQLSHIAMGRKNDRHLLFVGGQKYNATREVYQQAREGEHVRLSIGAGSRTVFALEPVD